MSGDKVAADAPPQPSSARSADGNSGNSEVVEQPEVDDFGLPVRQSRKRVGDDSEKETEESDVEEFVDAPSGMHGQHEQAELTETAPVQAHEEEAAGLPKPNAPGQHGNALSESKVLVESKEISVDPAESESQETQPSISDLKLDTARERSATQSTIVPSPIRERKAAKQVPVVSEWSHMQLAPKKDDTEEEGQEVSWQTMPAYAPFDIYNDDGKLVAKEEQAADYEAEMMQYGTLGGAGKGYTRVQMDEDAQSATSMDDNTAYLFKEQAKAAKVADEDEDEDDEELRDASGQMQATKQLLTEGQRIAYVGTVRLTLIDMVRTVEKMERTKKVRKVIEFSGASMLMWSQKIMLKLYTHMEIGADEQVMIEQLAEHGVQASDLTPALMTNARVKNPAKDETSEPNASPERPSTSSSRPSVTSPPPSSVTSPRQSFFASRLPFVSTSRNSVSSPDLNSQAQLAPSTASLHSAAESEPPPPYDEHQPKEFKDVKSPSEIGDQKSLDIDIRWTVLCDLFLILIADANYDARSRTLLETVGEHLQVSWLEICRFEKRVTDALEMQEAADKENWNEDEHLETRRKEARKRRLMVMGLATVGGSLVIGLSAGLLAPVIGAGLAAGFTTIGVAGTSGFLAGAGGAAIVTTTGIVTGGTVGVRAANRRTGAVKTFEYRPLHNNKRVNLIVTISGWMNGKVDDVRLPFSTVDPIMGDIYSIHWEPEMLQSMGATIAILATEALTSTLQQVLGSTILVTLMAAIQLPIILTKLSYLIDNPWSVSMARADLAGLILADSLVDRNLGSRPITLVGFSLGARVIYSCLRELARRGQPGIVQNVYIFGTPVIANKDEFLRCKSVVSGRFLNGYATNDWILGYLFRATGGGISKVAGLAQIDELPGIENVNVTEWVPGHMSYRAAMPRLLREVGWEVTSDEFTEIEDPDPDNHDKRQRELINEIEEARRQLDEKNQEAETKKTGRFAFWRKKKAEKKEWETYDEKSKAGGVDDSKEKKELEGGDLEKRAEGVLFDIDAIKAEVQDLAEAEIQIKEIKSTLPPMKIDITSFNGSGPRTPPAPLRLTKSHSQAVEPSQREDNFADHEVTMSFDSPSAAGRSSPAVPPKDWAIADSGQPSPGRPPLKSHVTAPVNMHPEHNAWVDEEDTFDHESEIKMTFA